MPRSDREGAFVVSLDFELHWGLRDLQRLDGPYAAHLHGAREAVPAMLALFARYGIRATWATVGFLFARDRAERVRYDPAVRPAYADPALDPYAEPVGADEAADPLHYAASLLDQIRRTPGQEIGTHTYSHYYPLEAGGTEAAFAADLASARSIAAARGIALRSMVFPRNQVNPAYAGALRAAGITAYRGNPSAWMYRAAPFRAEGLAKRGARLLDAHVPLTGDLTQGWDEVVQPCGLADVRGGAFLQPLTGVAFPDLLHTRRVARGIEHAAREGRIFHLWWHPHNLGVRTGEQLARLESLLEHAAACRAHYGLRAMTMAEVAEAAPAPTSVRKAGGAERGALRPGPRSRAFPALEPHPA